MAKNRDLTNVGGIGKASRDVRDVAAMARPTSLQLLIRWKDWKVESFQVGERGQLVKVCEHNDAEPRLGGKKGKEGDSAFPPDDPAWT